MAAKAADNKLAQIELPTDMVQGEHVSADLALFTDGMKPEEREAYLAEIQRIAEHRKDAFGSMSQKLALPQRPGYKRHWFNEAPGRIEDAAGNGWTHVQDKSRKPVKRIVGSARHGGPLYAYAMEIPMPFWVQDMTRRHQIARDRMDQIKTNPISAPSGMAQRSDRDKFYTNRNEALSIRETVAIDKRPEAGS